MPTKEFVDKIRARELPIRACALSAFQISTLFNHSYTLAIMGNGPEIRENMRRIIRIHESLERACDIRVDGNTKTLIEAAAKDGFHGTIAQNIEEVGRISDTFVKALTKLSI